MRRLLLFRLYGPLASWGDVAVGEVRPILPRPGRSALLGLLSAALGITRDEREELESLAEAVGFAVVVESRGAPLRDFHTAQVPPQRGGKRRRAPLTRAEELSGPAEELSTILSRRDYLADALWSVAVWTRDEQRWGLERLAAALRQPVFHLSLGRKSCPLALPLDPRVVEAATLADALRRGATEEWPAFAALAGYEAVRREMYWEAGGPDPGVPVMQVAERRDVPLSRTRWTFGVRSERLGALEMEG